MKMRANPPPLTAHLAETDAATHRDAAIATSSAVIAQSAVTKDTRVIHNENHTEQMPFCFYDDLDDDDSWQYSRVRVLLHFRQWRDSGHCNTVHTYDTEITVGTKKKDYREPKIQKLRQAIEAMSGSLLVADDDPELAKMVKLGSRFAKCLVVPHVGCERLAEWIKDLAYSMDVHVNLVEVREHESNAGGVFWHPLAEKWQFYSMKTYTQTRGLTTSFIKDGKLQGGSLKVSVLFAANVVDSRNWTIPFGQLKVFKESLDHDFDHTFLVDKRHEDEVDLAGIAGVRYMDRPSIDQISSRVFAIADDWLQAYRASIQAGAKSNEEVIASANFLEGGIHVAGTSVMLVDGRTRGFDDKNWTHTLQGFLRG